MPSYHINGRGDPGVCRATIQCPFGGEEEHFNTATQARVHYEVTQGPVFVPGTRRPGVTPRSNPLGRLLLEVLRMAVVEAWGEEGRKFMRTVDFGYQEGVKWKVQAAKRQKARDAIEAELDGMEDSGFAHEDAQNGETMTKAEYHAFLEQQEVMRVEIEQSQAARAKALIGELEEALAKARVPASDPVAVQAPTRSRALTHFEKLAKGGTLTDEALTSWAQRDNAGKIALLGGFSKIRDVPMKELDSEQVEIAARLMAEGLIVRSPKDGGSWVMPGSDEKPADEKAVRSAVLKLKKSDRTALFAAVGADTKAVTEENLPAVLKKAADLRDEAARP